MMMEGDTRGRILASACDLIYSRSYASVGVAEICEKAQVKKGSFYHFFPSKQELGLAVIETLLAEFENRVLIPAFARDQPPLARLGRFIETIYAVQREWAGAGGRLLGCPFGNLTLELAASDEPVRQKLESVFAAIQGRFEQVLREAQGRRQVGALDIPATAQAMLAYLEGVLLMAKAANDPELILRLGPALARIRILPVPA